MSIVEERRNLFDARVAAADAAHSVQRSESEAVSLAIFRDVSDAENVWRAFEATADCTAFQTYDWHSAWQRHIGNERGVTPAIVVGRARGAVAFILPLAIDRGRGIRRLVWHASELCDYNAPLLASDFAETVGGDFDRVFKQVMRAIAAETRFDAVVLTRMPETVGGQRNPMLDLDTTLNPSGAYLMTIAGPWEQFYKDKRSSATRRHDRSKRKRLAEFGAVEFVTAVEPCDVEKTLDALFAQKAASFATRGVSNFLAPPGTREFFRALGANPRFRDMLHIARLQVGTTVAATNLGLVFRGRYYHVLASYDAGPVSRFGPGTAHLHDLISYAIGRGCTTFDFTVGDEPYKRDWCDGELSLHDFRLATSFRGWLAVTASMAKARVKRFVKQTPRLSQAVYRSRIAIAAFRRGRGQTAAAAEPAETAGDR